MRSHYCHFLQVKARFLQEEAKRTEQQLLAGFAKAQKSLLLKVLEGLVLLLAVSIVQGSPYRCLAVA
jgi:hypothetical protein